MAQATEPAQDNIEDNGAALSNPTQPRAVTPETTLIDNLPLGTTVRVIINPTSGKKGGITTNASGPDEVRAALEQNGIEAEIRETEYAGHATKLAEQAVHDGIDIVIACGGDGTVGEVAKALVNKKKTTLGILPLGSANNVARMTGVP